jgi:hypothetical protein
VFRRFRQPVNDNQLPFATDCRECGS